MKKVFSEIANSKMSPFNKGPFENAVLLEIAILACDEHGLEIESVEWTNHFKPFLTLRANAQAKQLVQTGKARLYGTSSDGVRRFDLYQTEINGVKCKWKSERETKSAPRGNHYAKKYH